MVGFFPQQDSLEDTGANAEEKQGLIVEDTDNMYGNHHQSSDMIIEAIIDRYLYRET